MTCKILHVQPARGGSAEVECLHCGTTMTVSLDEDGAPSFESTPCHDDNCNARLCPNCPQFTCDSCQLPHCLEHKVDYGGMALCPVCMALEAEIEGADLCECRYIDADQVDSRGCPQHGETRRRPGHAA